MIYIKLFFSTMLLLISAFSFSGSHFNLDTEKLIFSQDSVEWSEFCGYSEVSYNEEDGSLDLVYNDYIAVAYGDEITNLVCQFKIDIEVPEGWEVAVATDAGVGGNYVGTNIASFSHTLAGTVSQAGFKYLIGEGSFVINEEYQALGSSTCGENVTLKTVANIIAIGNGDFSLINLNNGSLSGTTTSWKHYMTWKPCD